MKTTQRASAILIGLSILLFTAPVFANTKIKICTDTNYWYPFTFVKNTEPSGLHIDIISKALRNLGYDAVFKPSEWQECLNQAKQGKVDAIATASYRDDRATFLNYPEGAATDKKSPWRVSQVEYRVITATENAKGEKNTYEFNGDLKALPQPVRVPRNYSVAADLKKEGLKIKEGKNSLDIFKSLAKERTGSVVDIEEVAVHLKTQPEYAEKLVIQSKPLNLKSYFLAFSKSGQIKTEEAEKIWKEIAKVRSDETLMAEFLKKY